MHLSNENALLTAHAKIWTHCNEEGFIVLYFSTNLKGNPMATWISHGRVLLNSGRREHEGPPPPPPITRKEREKIGRRLEKDRRKKLKAGKKSYQPQRLHFA